jgi:8-oxo-dGTP diphosphatase
MKPAAIAVILNSEKDQLLLIQRRDAPVWVLPGGGIDAGETAEQAVIRETLEETGLHVSVVRKFGEYTPVNKLAAYTELFECLIKDGVLAQSEESRAIGFFPLDKLPRDFFFLHKEWLEDFLKNSPVIIRRPITTINYWNLFKFFLRHPLQLVCYFISRMKGRY